MKNPDLYTKAALTLIALLLAGQLIERLSGPANVRVTNQLREPLRIDFNGPQRVEFDGPQKMQLCDDQKHCADLTPNRGAIGMTYWGLVVTPAQELRLP